MHVKSLLAALFITHVIADSSDECSYCMNDLYTCRDVSLQAQYNRTVLTRPTELLGNTS